jgi:hypothetical protein
LFFVVNFFGNDFIFGTGEMGRNYIFWVGIGGNFWAKGLKSGENV